MPNSARPDPFAAIGTRTLLMGIVNMTPDSFSGDGLLGEPGGLDRYLALLDAEACDIVDVGGESTRPGATPVPADVETARVVPALEAARQYAMPISIDTTKASVARQALSLGACIINDVSGFNDPETLPLVAESDSWIVAVHPGPMRAGERPIDSVARGLTALLTRAAGAGVSEDRILVDPGLGFGKTWQDNLAIVRDLHELHALGRPILVGPSRKGMISRVLGVERPDRLEGTLALVTMCIAGGADIVRAHDIRAVSRTARMADALVR